MTRSLLSRATHGAPACAALAVTLAAARAAAQPSFPVHCGTDQIGTVTVTDYQAMYTTAPFGRDPQKRPGIEHGAPRIDLDVRGGARFKAFFDFTGCPTDLFLRPGTQFRWVQIVYTDSPNNDPHRGQAPTTGYVDPWSPPGGATADGYEDHKPFYWTDAEWSNVGTGGNFPNTHKLLFSDYSSRTFTDVGVSWRAELNLVCTWDMVIHPLGWFDWGWSMPADMLSDPSKTISLAPAAAAWHDGASPGLGKLEAATEFGNFGWRLTDARCCIASPEPAPLALLAGGALLILPGLRRARRRARADAA